MRYVILSLCLVGLCAGVASAQTPGIVDPPKMSDTDSLKLTNALLATENAQLKVAAMQAEVEKLKTALTALIKSLEKPGYRLERDGQGAFVYVAVRPPDPPKAEKK